MSFVLGRLSGRHVVITGAGRGIGRSIALLFAQHGATLSLWSRTSSELESVAAIVRETYVHNRIQSVVSTKVVDVRDSDSVDQAAANARAQLGNASIIINNAGSVIRCDVLQMSNQQWRDTFATNIDGAFYVTRAFASDLRLGHARVINIASIAGRQGTAGLAAYCAAKHALVGFTRALAIELKGMATVNAICPGSVDTQMLQEGLPGAKADMTPADIADTALFLAVDAPVALTGTCLDVFG
jgi:3-hydroxybutyrate dehydrogenase